RERIPPSSPSRAPCREWRTVGYTIARSGIAALPNRVARHCLAMREPDPGTRLARGLFAVADESPLFGEQGPALMIAPSAGELDVASGKALEREASATDHGNRRA